MCARPVDWHFRADPGIIGMQGAAVGKEIFD
jgi:hypothetical protein